MDNKIQKPIVGKKLLQMLMLQLYSNPRCIYREYIQNSLDAINEAVRLGVLKQAKDGRVSINIYSNDIIIEDNGTGIKTSQAPKVLMDIANSLKNGIDTAGQFGVGRLSGGGYCEKLEFTTSWQDESVATTVTMDILKLRKILSEDNTDISAEEVMEKICEVSTKEEKTDSHYFKVILHNITNSSEILLNQDDIMSYIRQTAPIGYNTMFQTLINNNHQRDFVERHRKIEKIKVSLNECPDVEKSYGLKVKGSGDEIVGLKYFELPIHAKFGRLAWGWYAITPFTKQIDEQYDENVGIRLRKHNISLEKNILDSLFREPRGNKYFYGEIFITNENIEPDSGRQGMAAGEEADALREQLRTYFKDVLYKVYTKANKYKSDLKNIRETVDRFDTAIDSAAKPMIADKLHELINKFNKATEPSAINEVNDIINIYKKQYKKELNQKVTNIIEHYGRKPPTPIPSPAQPTPPPSVPNTAPTSASASTPKPSSLPSPQPVPPPSPRSLPGSPSPKPRSKPTDMFASLTNSGIYTEKEIVLLRQVYKFMGYICSPAEKKKLTELMQWAINNIINERNL